MSYSVRCVCNYGILFSRVETLEEAKKRAVEFLDCKFTCVQIIDDSSNREVVC